MIDLGEALSKRKTIILDGAFGTQLAARGGGSVPLAVLESPELARAIHADYADAGADVVLANTFAANPISLEHHGAADRFEELNRKAVELCRDAVGPRCFVAGDVGPTGKLLEPYGDAAEDELFKCFAAQCALLDECGVDLIIIETMTDVSEAEIAVKAAKSAAGVPVVASVSFDPGAHGYRTVFGQDPAHTAQRLQEAGADAVGSNCGTVDPVQMSEIMAEMSRAASVPLCAEPNAGKPELSAGTVAFRLDPDSFADGVLRCIESGAVVAGGCCGTTPAHIAALARRLR